MNRAKYYAAVRPRTNDYHALHKEGCPFIPENENRIYLGEFSSGMDALRVSQQIFKKAKCCIFCSKEAKAFNDDKVLLNMTKVVRLPEERRIPLSFHQSLVCGVN